MLSSLTMLRGRKTQYRAGLDVAILPKILPADLWEQRMHAVVAAGQKDPCHATRLSKRWYWQAGFGSRANNFVNDLALAILHNESFAVCGGQPTDTLFYSKFSHHGLPIAECTSCRPPPQCPTCPNPADVADPLAHDIGEIAGLAAANKPYVDSLKRMIAKHLFLFNDNAQRQIAEVLNPVFAKVPSYIGLHIRHGDKGKEAQLLPASTYAKEVARYLPAQGASKLTITDSSYEEADAERGTHTRSDESGTSQILRRAATTVASVAAEAGIQHVYVASDDPRAQQEVKNLFQGQQITVLAAPDLSKTTMWASTLADERALLALFIDLHALNKADIFIGTASSNIGRFVYYLRDHNQQSISLDQGGDWNSKQG